MTDKDKLQVLYNYIKMIEPNERIYFKNKLIFVDGFGSSYLEIYCKDNKFAAQSSGLNCDWLHKIFKVYRVSMDKVRDIIPYDVFMIECNRYYILNPRNDELFK